MQKRISDHDTNMNAYDNACNVSPGSNAKYVYTEYKELLSIGILVVIQ